jgi:hypothetical protein
MPGALQRLKQSPRARRYLEWTAGTAGNLTGLAKSPERVGRGLLGTATFGLRLLDPTDKLRSPPGEAAWDVVDRNVAGLAKQLVNVEALPEALEKGIARTKARYVPSATPASAILEDELRRQFKIGENQGELMFDVATAGIGGPFAKSKLLEVPRPPVSPRRFEAQGFNPKLSLYLALPYRGRGSHFIPKRLTPLFGEAFIESDFNVSKPFGMSWGEFYEYHYGVDDRFHGARTPDRVGRESWSGKRIGARRFGPVERIWKGAPVPLRARVLGGGAFGGALLAQEQEDADQ